MTKTITLSLFIFLFLQSFDAVGQSFTKIKTFIGQDTSFPNQYQPYNSIIFKDKFYFTQDDGIHGTELWASNGDTTYTKLFRDFNLGSYHSNPSNFQIHNDLLFFNIQLWPSLDNELWYTNGSDTGTHRVFSSEYLKDGTIQGLYPADSALIITVSKGTDTEVWVLDNQGSPPQKLTVPASQGQIKFIMQIGNSYLFESIEFFYGSMWSLTGNNTEVLLDSIPQASFTKFIEISKVNSDSSVILLVSNSDSSLLIKTNGTVSGTSTIKNIGPNIFNPEVDTLKKDGDSVLFHLRYSNTSQVWMTDGTASGTHLVNSFYFIREKYRTTDNLFIQVNYNNSSTIDSLLAWNDSTQSFTVISEVFRDKLVQISDTFYGLSVGHKVRVIHGTPPTSYLFNIVYSPSETVYINRFQEVENELYIYGSFVNTSGNVSFAYWKFDKSDSTFHPRDSSLFFNPSNLPLLLPDSIFFYRALDRYSGYEWFRSDGTSDGTYTINDLKLDMMGYHGFLQPIDSSVYFAMRDLTSIGGYFNSTGAYHNDFIWKSDGTTETTKSMEFAPSRINSSTTKKINGKFVFFALNGLWTTDLTNGGTERLSVIESFNSKDFGKLVKFKNHLYFPKQDLLLRTDGTPVGTWPIKDIFSGTRNVTNISRLTPTDSLLFFVADDGTTGYELWSSDGTPAGTHLVKDINPGIETSYAQNLTSTGNLIYFSANDGLSGLQLWRSDGTDTGTFMVKKVNLDKDYGYVGQLIAADSHVYFFTYYDTYTKLWKSDGTDSGTILLHTFFPRNTSHYSIPSEPIYLRRRIYFLINGKLWSSNGTTEGTFPLFLDERFGVASFTPKAYTNLKSSSNINPVQYSSRGSIQMKKINDIIFLSGRTIRENTELWKVDGDGLSVKFIEDFLPGPRGGGPLELEADANGRLFALANDSTGIALWVDTIPMSHDFFTTDTFCFYFISQDGDTIRNDTSFVDRYKNIFGSDSTIAWNVVVNGTAPENVYVESCGPFTSPSGKLILNDTLFTDTLHLENRCDSFIRLNIKIYPTSIDTTARTVCDSLVLDNGRAFYTSTFFSDTLANYYGCDSILIRNLTILNSTFSNISVNQCENYTSPSGRILSTSGTYSDTLINTIGCDSIITIDLIIRDKASTSIDILACDSYQSRPGNIYTTSTSYYDTLTNNLGCDSIISVNLRVNKSSRTNESVTECLEYIDRNGTKITSSSIYNDTLKTQNGCDSIIAMNVTIIQKLLSEITLSACLNYISPSGNRYNQSGIYKDTIPNSQGCDSIITTNLTIDTADTRVTKEQRTLRAIATNGVEWYHWKPCNLEHVDLSNSSARTFTPANEGWYSVTLNQNGCVDTSKCFFIGSTNLDQNITIGPNPTFDQVFVSLGYNFESISYVLYNALGKKIDEKNYTATNAFKIDMSHYASGIYSLKVFDGKDEVTFQIVKIR
jgi:ELWxxDGT repeat protein